MTEHNQTAIVNLIDFLNQRDIAITSLNILQPNLESGLPAPDREEVAGVEEHHEDTQRRLKDVQILSKTAARCCNLFWCRSRSSSC